MLKENLKKKRLKENLTQVELAEKAGVFSNTISMIELGKNTNPSLEVLKKLADALGVTVNDLIE